jgi:hypothetical protein
LWNTPESLFKAGFLGDFYYMNVNLGLMRLTIKRLAAF